MVKTRVNIEAERGRMQLTKKEICEQLGVTGKTYNAYIHGASIPSDILEKLHDMTGQTVDYLLGLTNPQKGATQ